MVLAACGSTRTTIEQQREKLESLGASTRLLADNWLAGRLPERYTGTAFEALYDQVEQQRSTLAAARDTLADPDGAALSAQAEQLSRTIAAMRQDLRRHDDEALRRRTAAIPLASH
jgi:hypothetical protein